MHYAGDGTRAPLLQIANSGAEIWSTFGIISAGGSCTALFIRTQNTIIAAPDMTIMKISTDPAMATTAENFSKVSIKKQIRHFISFLLVLQC